MTPHSALLAVDCLWRIIADGRISLTVRDHCQQFGPPEAVDAHAEALALLDGRRITSAMTSEAVGDFTFECEGQRRLALVNDSSGYEPWNLTAPGVHLIAMGGGGISDFSPKA